MIPYKNTVMKSLNLSSLNIEDVVVMTYLTEDKPKRMHFKVRIKHRVAQKVKTKVEEIDIDCGNDEKKANSLRKRIIRNSTFRF